MANRDRESRWTCLTTHHSARALLVEGDDLDAQVRELIPDGADHAFDAIGRTSTTEHAIRMLGIGGAAVLVGLPPEGTQATFDPLTLAVLDQRILGSNYGSVRPARDIPVFVDLVMDGKLHLEELISARVPLEQAETALADLNGGHALRTLLIP